MRLEKLNKSRNYFTKIFRLIKIFISAYATNKFIDHWRAMYFFPWYFKKISPYGPHIQIAAGIFVFSYFYVGIAQMFFAFFISAFILYGLFVASVSDLSEMSKPVLKIVYEKPLANRITLFVTYLLIISAVFGYFRNEYLDSVEEFKLKSTSIDGRFRYI